MKLLTLLSLFVGLFVAVLSECNRGNCAPGQCGCFSTSPPDNLTLEDTPQLVMLTFDDGVNVVNYRTYKDLLMTDKKNKANQCPIKATFYVTHDYTNYHYVNQLHRYGNELSVHSISHIASTEYWKKADAAVWKAELVGMRTILSNLALIPESDIIGNRVPFLQTAGNVTFSVLNENGFLYDSSMPTRTYTDPPLWPYTLDHDYRQDCQIPPCPNGAFPGLWLVPMVNWELGNFPCAMADACVPTPETEAETLDYMKTNFMRHYGSNKAPFPVFLHQAWLQNDERKSAYFKFIDWLLEKDDVFLTTVREVVEYMKNPVSLQEFAQKPCASLPLANKCKFPGLTCQYQNTPPGGTRYMVTCGKSCPKSYPWTGNPTGQ